MTVLLPLALVGSKSLARALAIEATDEARDLGVLVNCHELVQVRDRHRRRGSRSVSIRTQQSLTPTSQIIDLSAIWFALDRGER
ncbi:MAG: hypothetical protein WBP81_19190 [Solirubrobacteraceae bacterium]